jgi:hypothetical protein
MRIGELDFSHIVTEDDTLIFDPTLALSDQMLRIYERRHQQYEAMETAWFRDIELGLTRWEGSYEGKDATWLRWYDHDRELILTGAESTIKAEGRVVENELARLRTELERLRGPA